MNDERTFLLTGGTGVVGSAIVPLLLAEPATTVHLLLRAASAETLGYRLRALFDFWGNRVDQRDASHRLFAVSGDVAQPRLGMAERDYYSLAESVTNVIHSAGNVKLNESIDVARASAVFPVREGIQ